MNRLYFTALVFVFIFAVLGELARLPLGPLNGLLPNDLLIALLAGGWLIDKTLFRRAWPKTSLWAPFVIFAVIAGISLLNGSRVLAPNEILVSGFYWMRFVEYFLLTFIILDLARNPIYHRRIFNLVIVTGVALSLLGFLQLNYYPDFTTYQDYGWDPHINRLLSTWFDPNFVGGMMAFVLSLIIAKLLDRENPKSGLILAGGILLLALMVTYSRSAYLAFLSGIFMIGFIKSKKLLIGTLIVGLVLVSVSERAQDRVSDAYHSGLALFGLSAELPDATARLRVDSWKNAATIIKDHPLLGVGYNAFTFAQARYGFVKTLEKHSASGSDSTALTILATTGVIGLAAYGWIIFTLLWISFYAKKNPVALGFFAGTCGLLVHSIFVNSLLFTPLLIFFYTGAGLMLSSARQNDPIRLCSSKKTLEFVNSSPCTPSLN